jgi:hypothetical protein
MYGCAFHISKIKQNNVSCVTRNSTNYLTRDYREIKHKIIFRESKKENKNSFKLVVSFNPTRAITIIS